MKILRTNKNPDENPDLPMSLKSLLTKIRQPLKYNPFCEEQKQTLFFYDTNPSSSLRFEKSLKNRGALDPGLCVFGH